MSDKKTKQLIKERRKALIKALPEMKQTFHALRVNNEDGSCFCIQGAMCEVYRKLRKTGSWNDEQFYYNGDSYTAEAPQQVLNYFGISGMTADRFLDWNDRIKLPFKQFAEKIKELD